MKVTTKVGTQRMSVLSTFTRLLVCCLCARSDTVPPWLFDACGAEDHDPGARPVSNV